MEKATNTPAFKDAGDFTKQLSLGVDSQQWIVGV